MSAKGTALEKAVARLDAAFAALPQERRQALGLAIYRCYPAMKQYLTDVDDLFGGEGISEAIWSILIAMAFILPRGKDAAIEKVARAFSTRAPVLRRFVTAVTDACTRPPIAITDGGASGGSSSETDPKVLPATAP